MKGDTRFDNRRILLGCTMAAPNASIRYNLRSVSTTFSRTIRYAYAHATYATIRAKIIRADRVERTGSRNRNESNVTPDVVADAFRSDLVRILSRDLLPLGYSFICALVALIPEPRFVNGHIYIYIHSRRIS